MIPTVNNNCKLLIEEGRIIDGFLGNYGRYLGSVTGAYVLGGFFRVY